jgi:hypothetical protein
MGSTGRRKGGIERRSHASRFLLLCEALESTREDLACTAFERLFRERGLPRAIRSDNGVPFASPNAPRSGPTRACVTHKKSRRVTDVLLFPDRHTDVQPRRGGAVSVKRF